MPFNPSIPSFMARLGVPIDNHGPHEGQQTHDAGQGRRQPGVHARVQNAFTNFAEGRGARVLESVFSRASPSSPNFWNAIFAETGWNPAAATHTDETRPTTPGQRRGSSTPPSDHFGAGLHGAFSRIFDVVPPGLEALLQNRSEHISDELADFKQRLTEYKNGGSVGQPPAPPRSVPRHIRNLMVQLDPNDPEYEQTVYEMVTADSNIQQQARQQMNDNIGHAPRPRPGHEHGVSGGAYEPEDAVAADGTPLFQESEGFDRPVEYEQRPPAPTTRTPAGNPATYRSPAVSDERDGPPVPPQPRT